MKKTICLLIVVMTLFSCANALAKNEITLLGIPWQTTETEVIHMLSEKGYLSKESSGVKLDSFYYLMEDADGSIEQIENGEYGKFCRTISLKDIVKGKIAGAPISDLVLSYAYDGEYQLIYAEVVLLGTSYKDIKQKIEKVYGEGTEHETILGYQITAWKGANNTCVILYTYDDGITFNLYYGKTDAEEILSNGLNVDPEDVSGL